MNGMSHMQSVLDLDFFSMFLSEGLMPLAGRRVRIDDGGAPVLIGVVDHVEVVDLEAYDCRMAVVAIEGSDRCLRISEARLRNAAWVEAASDDEPLKLELVATNDDVIVIEVERT
jgi:hypothetical protein